MDQTDNHDQAEILSVSRLNASVKLLLEGKFPRVWVEGEISNLAQPRSGHLYFSLKDDQAQVRCALFRGQTRYLKSAPADGMQVLVRGRVSLYEARGDYQLIIDYLEPAGEGALRQAFEALKQRLAQEGLFDPVHKLPLPRLPKRIGLITSATGAVQHDVLTTLQRRFPAIPVILHAVPVQGEQAAASIVAALNFASREGKCDALILARGGGSLEDLWPFNEEIVARAIYACRIPVVSGIGHDTDYTIADLVADLRAPTPTAAAELLSPDQLEWWQQFTGLETRLRHHLQTTLQTLQQRLDLSSARLAHPQARIAQARQRLGEFLHRLHGAQRLLSGRYTAHLGELRARLQGNTPINRIHQLTARNQYFRQRLATAIRYHLTVYQQRFSKNLRYLEALNPLATLARGYAVVKLHETDKIIRDASRLNIGDRVDIKLAKGGLDCVVEKIKKT